MVVMLAAGAWCVVLFVASGTVRHNRKGQTSITKEEGNVTFSRSGLAQYMIDQAGDD